MRKIKWTLEKVKIEALKYNARGKFRYGNPSAYNFARKNNILDEVCSHMKLIYKNWANEELAKEALKYKTRYEFQKYSKAAFYYALRRNLINKNCSHMEFKPSERWTNKELAEEAKKYKTKIEFREKYNGTYQVAIKRNILDKITSHMKKSSGISRGEKELFDTLLKKIKNLSNKFFKVNIINKPHIKRFQIDIFDPTTNRGIEFDGTYHHSTERLIQTKTKIGWPEEDSINYHKIKDKALLNCHGIKILHIKENDWIKNKAKCIDRCLNFLGIQN